jgi:hypothetical protein
LKKQKKKRKKRQRVRSQPRLSGFDFGIDQFFMLVSDFEFSNLLHDANISGCAYGLSYNEDVRDTVPMISLGARKIDPLKRALEILRGWDPRSGDDGFNLEFILLRSGGYLVAISPDFEALRNRIAQSDRFFAPLGLNVSWMYEFSRQGPWISDFRRYVNRPVGPFIFTGCELVSADKPPRHVPGLPTILKFQAQFSDEGAASQNTFARAILERRTSRGRHGDRGRVPPRPKQTPEAIRSRRSEQLRRHFPVTLRRLDGQHALEGFKSRNASLNLKEWQYQQACCNVVLSIEMTGQPHYSGFSGRELVGAVGQRLIDRIELANMPSLPSVSDNVLIAQVVLDGEYLLKERECRDIPRSPAELIGKIAAEGLL